VERTINRLTDHRQQTFGTAFISVVGKLFSRWLPPYIWSRQVVYKSSIGVTGKSFISTSQNYPLTWSVQWRDRECYFLSNADSGWLLSGEEGNVAGLSRQSWGLARLEIDISMARS
jgi:hypothetical protein